MTTPAPFTVAVLLGHLAAAVAAQHGAAPSPLAPVVPPAAAHDDVRREAPPPQPVTAAEQAALRQPLQPDAPPEVGHIARLSPDLAAGAASFVPWNTPAGVSSLLACRSGVTLARAPEAGGSLLPSATNSIGFDDYIGLFILPDRAGYTFASSPFYIEGCGSGWVHVKENDIARYGAAWGSGYGHYHLMYEAGPFCIPSGASYGFQFTFGSISFCVPIVDPATQPRYLASHHGTQWIRVYVYRSGVAEMNFDFRSIRVKGTQGIKLYFRKADGSWWHWNNLAPGWWNTAPYAGGIREILFRAANDSSSSYSVDDIEVSVL